MRSRRSGGRTQESRMDDVPTDSRGEREEREEGTEGNYLRGLGGWAGMCASILRIRWPTRIMVASTSSSFTCRPQARSIATISPSSRAASSSSLTQRLIRRTPVCNRLPSLPALLATTRSFLEKTPKSSAGALSPQMCPSRPIPPAPPLFRRSCNTQSPYK